jgi:hypothetical protein
MRPFDQEDALSKVDPKIAAAMRALWADVDMKDVVGSPIADALRESKAQRGQRYQDQVFYGFDMARPGADHSAFVKTHLDEDGNLHVDQIDITDIYNQVGPSFLRTMGRSVLEEAKVIQANRPHACPVRETRYFTMCHDGLRRDKRTKRWQTCEICEGFGFIE